MAAVKYRKTSLRATIYVAILFGALCGFAAFADNAPGPGIPEKKPPVISPEPMPPF